MTDRQKNILLIVGFVLLLVFGYQFAISETLEKREELKRLKAEQELLKDIPRKLASLRQREAYYDEVLGKYQIQGQSIQANILRAVNNYVSQHGLSITEFKEPHVIERNGLTVNTYEFTLRGGYNELIGLIHQLEQKTRFGELSSVRFEKKRDYRRNRDYLTCTIWLQHVQ